MPVRSLSSSVMRWPDRQQVHRAFSLWVEELAAQTPTLVAAGYFGSDARGDFGVGSDLDIIIILTESDLAFERRYNVWDLYSIIATISTLILWHFALVSNIAYLYSLLFGGYR